MAQAVSQVVPKSGFLEMVERELTVLENMYRDLVREAEEVLDRLYYVSYYGYDDGEIRIRRNGLNRLVVVINGKEIEYGDFSGTWTLVGDPRIVVENKDRLLRLARALNSFHTEMQKIQSIIDRAEALATKLGKPEILDNVLQKITKYLEEPRILGDGI